MARPREFNVDQALDQAMKVFWDKGYEATSMNDLLAAMCLSKSSFYDTFGSKHELLLQVLDHYADTWSVKTVALLEREGPAREVLALTFSDLLDNAEQRREQGCLINNCAVERASHDSQAAARVARTFAMMEEAFTRVIRRGQKRGEIDDGRDAEALGRYLNTVLQGVVVMGKSGQPRDALESVIGIALESL